MALVKASPQPALDDLLRHLFKFGPDGILESAGHLSDEERRQLDQEVRYARKTVRYAKTRRRRPGGVRR